MARKIKRKIGISIEVELGSDFQEQFAINCLRAAVDGWRFSIPAYHKNNKIQKFDFNVGDEVPQCELSLEK